MSEYIGEQNREQYNGLDYARIDASQCITARHLFESIIGSVATALGADQTAPRRCETLAQLAVHFGDLLQSPSQSSRWRFVLILDSIDKQRDAPPTLLPALAQLSELVSVSLSYATHRIFILWLTHLDSMPYHSVHRHFAACRVPTYTDVGEPTLSAIFETGICSDPGPHAPRDAQRHNTPRNS